MAAGGGGLRKADGFGGFFGQPTGRRQRPGTAKGIVFVSLEDETGVANAVVRSGLSPG
ncbi:hypothetical protein OPIT5_22545 [Opitutaceae bacterium TAV5]|nr:hypothetical protein OPIT5_22545 [Opitutaceae bacterium TAV5]